MRTANGRRKAAQPSLFPDGALPPPRKREKPRPAPAELRIVSEDGAERTLTDAEIDAAERVFGPCEDDNGVSLWRVLRDIKANGASRVQFI